MTAEVKTVGITAAEKMKMQERPEDLAGRGSGDRHSREAKSSIHQATKEDSFRQENAEAIQAPGITMKTVTEDSGTVADAGASEVREATEIQTEEATEIQTEEATEIQTEEATEIQTEEDSDRRGYGDSDRRGYGDSDRRGYGSHEGRGYSERKGFGTYSDRRNSGDRRDRRGFATDGERRPYGNRAGAGQGRTPGGRRPAARPYGRQFAENQAASGINKMIDRKRKQAEEAYSDFDYAPIPVKEEVRLNKFIANSGMCSRREADNFIQAGVVTVNGEVVTELGTKVRMTDDVRFNGERLKGEQKVYIVMNKPKGYVTTTSDPHAEKTVMDLLKGCKSRVFSVGRLDKNTTGVLMFTNDGEMAEKLTHPSYNKKKIYQVTLNTDLTQEDYDKILAGVMLTDGEIAADELEYIDDSDHRKLGIEIHSGKNRIVRRIFESLGYEVKSLDRVYFAGLTKKGLKKGHWRYLTDAEVNILKIGSYQ